MLKLALAHSNTILIAVRKSDQNQLVLAYGEEYGKIYDYDSDGYQYRGFPLSALPMLAEDFKRIEIVR